LVACAASIYPVGNFRALPDNPVLNFDIPGDSLYYRLDINGCARGNLSDYKDLAVTADSLYSYSGIRIFAQIGV